MIAELMLALLLISSICAVGLAIIAMEYLEEVEAREACLMKYGVCMQIWGFLVLCFLRLEYPWQDISIQLVPMVALVGAGVFMLGAISVVKAMAKARITFAVLSTGIQICVVTFLTTTACLMP